MSLRFSRPAGVAVTIGTLAVGLTACGGATHAATKAAGTSTQAAPTGDPHAEAPAAAAQPAVATSAVTVDNFSFMPAAIKVKTGTTVTWTNNDEEPHSVVSSEEPMRSPTLAGPHNTFTHTFTKPGTYHYNCGIHPFMHGTVEVQA
ncbi:MAG TPA: cupredoxin domain-containing protein [Acidimicrobiia bacterium]